MKSFASSVVALILLVIAGCGGGSSDNMTGTLDLAVTMPSAAGLPGTATATYASPNTDNPQGVDINFSTDRPDVVKLNAASAKVGTDGKANISFTYIAVPTDTTATIYASTGGLQAFQTLTITGSPGAPTVQPPVAAIATSIEFVAATPTSIALKGMGGPGSSETSDVFFKVRDANNNGLNGVIVDFALSTSVGGIIITPAAGTTDATGLVQTKVSSGIIATPVVVKATVRKVNLTDPTITTQSTQLVIKSGLPDQDSLSISKSNLNPEAWGVDGVQVTVTARLADHFNNQVSDGTAIYFTTEGGAIGPFCTTVNGSCSVIWNSQNPRPSDGRVTIFAYAVGEESFTDINGNGVADAGEFTDTPEAFRDDNNNAIRDASESFIDFNSDSVFNTPDGIFNGLLRPATVVGATSKHIFSNSTIVMASSNAVIMPIPSSLSAPGVLAVTVTDVNGNTMPSGTTIKITAPFGVVSGTTDYTVPQNISASGQTLSFFVGAGTTPVFKSGFITVAVTSPAGLKTEQLIPISGLF